MLWPDDGIDSSWRYCSTICCSIMLHVLDRTTDRHSGHWSARLAHLLQTVSPQGTIRIGAYIGGSCKKEIHSTYNYYMLYFLDEQFIQLVMLYCKRYSMSQWAMHLDKLYTVFMTDNNTVWIVGNCWIVDCWKCEINMRSFVEYCLKHHSVTICSAELRVWTQFLQTF